MNLTDHIAETAFLSLPEIAIRARAWGLTVRDISFGELAFTGPAGIAGGLTTSIDPVNRAIVLAFVLLGQEWYREIPGLVGAVNERWKAAAKPSAGRAKTVQQSTLFEAQP